MKQIPKRRGELIYGLAPCVAALQAGRRKIYNVFLQERFESGNDGNRDLRRLLLEKISSSVRKHNVKLHKVDKAVMTSLVGKKPHQGIAIDGSSLTYNECGATKLSQLFSNTDNNANVIWLALFQIQDPMNLGAILRCAYYMGTEHVFVTSNKSCCLSPVVSKASSGALELMKVHSVSCMPTMLKDAANKGWNVLGTCAKDTSHKSTNVNSYKVTGPTVLALGNEGKGLPQDIIKNCTSLLTIPSYRSLPPGFDSLNVAVATGILINTLKFSYLN